LPHAPRTDPYVHLCAYGSYLGCLTANRWLATCRMRSNACDTLSQSCAWRVLCWPAFPLVPVLGSPGSAADASALFAGFAATITGSDFPPPYIIGYGFSPSRCGPGQSIAAGQMRDLPASGAFLFARDVLFDPGRVATPRVNGIAHVAFDFLYSLRPCGIPISWLDRHPMQIAVYASWPALPSAHATLATGCLARASRTGLSPAGLHQLWLAPSRKLAKLSR
jgi:hypothetical protein